MLLRGNDFSKHISKLRMSRKIAKLYQSFHDFITNEMTINLYMFGAFMKYGIAGYMQSRLTVTMKNNRLEAGDT